MKYKAAKKIYINGREYKEGEILRVELPFERFLKAGLVVEAEKVVKPLPEYKDRGKKKADDEPLPVS